MLMEKAREELVKYGKKLVTAGLTKGTGGNLSVFDRENKMVAITPSGIASKETLRMITFQTRSGFSVSGMLDIYTN